MKISEIKQELKERGYNIVASENQAARLLAQLYGISLRKAKEEICWRQAEAKVTIGNYIIILDAYYIDSGSVDYYYTINRIIKK